MALEKRTISRHDNFKETQVEKPLKETRLPIAEKRKNHISEASSVKGKEVEASKSSDTLEEKRCEVQHQLFRCFMALQLEGCPNNVFAIHVNGTSLSFSTREFALVTGLKCVGNDADVVINEKVPNWLIETYFGGANLFKNKDLMKCFANKNWGHDNDRDALKIVVLYLIHTFIFSSEKNSTTIPRLHFDLVESGRYSEYPWGLKAFESLTKFISKKMDAQKKYYKIAGMPLAMQLHTVTSAYNCIQLLLHLYSCIQFNGYNCIQLNTVVAAFIITIVYRDIYTTNMELVVIQILPVGIVVENSPTPTRSDKSAEDSDDFSPTPDLQCKKKHATSVGPSSTPPYKKRKEQIIHPSNTDNQSKIPTVGVSEIAQNVLHHNQPSDSKNDEVSSLRKDLNSFKEYMLSEHLQDNQQKESLHQRKETIERRDDGIEMPYDANLQDIPKGHRHTDIAVGDNVENTVVNVLCVESRVEGITTSEVPCNIPHIGQDGVSTDFYVSQVELDDKFLPSQIPETRIVIYNSTSVKLTPIFEKKYPFEDDSITEPHPTLIIQEYDKWVRDGLLARHEQKSNLENHYKKNKSTLHIPLDFGVDQVNSKNWFYLLSFDDVSLTSAHIDVIFYYLRKKGKYNQTSNFKYTTVDCIFKTRIAEIFDMYADTDINLKDKLHWILVVVSFKERCIKVYDSYRFAGHDAYVASEIDKLAKLVPLYLSISGFYRDSQDIDWSTYSAYTDKSHTDPFEVVFISNLPQQQAGSMDCEVHVAAYAEFLSTLGEIPQTIFDSNLLRQRYGALLWDYALRKIDADAISKNEAPSKIARQITESDSKLQIVLE
ncbi:uncharacterized protein [Nicotiana sylvestris]|uniref:uncharacterized protein n=1 Tax=Nicotiana sylvestris TaxID=4096 RepID=UPI00388C4E36